MVYLPMKRAREEEMQNLTNMANYLMLLSKGTNIYSSMVDSTMANNVSSTRLSPSPRTQVFECKTCNRQFPSFQALGGHRASHKKPRLADGSDHHIDQTSTSPPKPKTHECSICGLEFAIGQALGGHMRRHRAAMADENHQPPRVKVPVLKRANSGKRVFGLDLNLTPLENAHLEFGKVKDVPPLVELCL